LSIPRWYDSIKLMFGKLKSPYFLMLLPGLLVALWFFSLLSNNHQSALSSGIEAKNQAYLLLALFFIVRMLFLIYQKTTNKSFKFTKSFITIIIATFVGFLLNLYSIPLAFVIYIIFYQ
jgi:hypothetical protein